MIKSTYSNGSSTTIDSIVLNSNGMMALWSSRNIQSSYVNVTVYTYASNEQLQKTTSQYSGGTITTTNYSFTNGDLTGVVSGTDTANYSYYLDKPISDGDYFNLSQLLNYGASYIKNAHLLKEVKEGLTDNNINYSFDADGKISGFSVTGGSVIENITYLYNCN